MPFPFFTKQKARATREGGAEGSFSSVRPFKYSTCLGSGESWKYDFQTSCFTMSSGRKEELESTTKGRMDKDEKNFIFRNSAGVV